ncbi:TPA: hypothetical protein OMP91_000133 [Acinetobacter baumannii]|nr:hypothetical protein [Acinetobacter baumannii]
MDKCREEFQKAFPIPAHWVEFDEKTNRYYCPYVADATASKYQSQWVVWQHLYEKMGELETAIDSLSDENAHFRNKKWDQNEDFTKLQAKVEELQRRNQMLNDNIKEQGQKLVYQNEVIETQAEKLLGLRNEKSELQKRVDAALKLIESWNEIAFDKTTHWTEGYEEGCYHCAAQLEQALKGDQYDEHRKKAEEAISKGASLTNHRIEL